MNFGEGQTELMARGFDYLSPTRLGLMLNLGKNAFEDFWHWPWLEQTLTGPAPLTVDRLKTVVYVQDSDHCNPLAGLDVRVIANDGSAVGQPGTPVYWWLDGPHGPNDTVTINTWPTGPATLEARVTVESPELSDVADVPLIPARYHTLWIDLAVVEAYHDSDNFASAGALEAAVNLRLQAVVLRYETRNRQHSDLNASYALSEDD
ncbi:MAG TPA: hypothetical protein VGJ70_02645 [Solirubrobacteraceae bacterium]